MATLHPRWQSGAPAAHADRRAGEQARALGRRAAARTPAARTGGAGRRPGALLEKDAPAHLRPGQRGRDRGPRRADAAVAHPGHRPWWSSAGGRASGLCAYSARGALPRAGLPLARRGSGAACRAGRAWTGDGGAGANSL